VALITDHCSLGTFLEVSFFLAVFHRGFGALVVGSGAAFGLAGCGDFGDDLIKI
jgi:hypothetical protein